MRIIGISGSPRNKSTNYMLRTLLNATGQKSELILLKNKRIFSCIDCRKCHKSYRCSINDDMQKIHKKLTEADIIVLGSPTYFNNVSGTMKNFMDRCLPFYFSKKLETKKSILLTTGNFKDELEFDKNGKCKWHKEETKSALACLRVMKDFCKIMGIKVMGSIYSLHEEPKTERRKLIKLGKKIKGKIND